MNNLQLATEFPDAKSTLKKLITEDKQRIRKYNDLENKVKSFLITHPQSFLFGVRELELIMLLASHHKQHIVRRGKTFNTILSCEDRLAKNQAILDLMERKGHPQAIAWLDKISRAKSYPMDNLLQFNRAGFTKCIWHNERTASLKYYKKTNTVYCFSCSKSEDVIGVAQFELKLSFKEAIEWLISRM